MIDEADMVDYEQLRDVYYPLGGLADAAQGKKPRTFNGPFENEPALIFDGCLSSAVAAGVIVEDREFFDRIVDVSRRLSAEFHDEGDTSGYEILDYRLDQFLEMHRQAGIIPAT